MFSYGHAAGFCRPKRYLKESDAWRLSRAAMSAAGSSRELLRRKTTKGPGLNTPAWLSGQFRTFACWQKFSERGHYLMPTW